MIRNSNPIFTSENYQRGEVSSRGMTVGGTVGKTLILFVMLLATAAYAYNQTLQGELSTTVFYGALISAFIVGFIAMSAPKLSPVLAPVYAAIEGVLIGMISAMYAGLYEGIVLQAVLATLGVFLACLTLYATGLVKVTPMFQKVVMGATLGIFFMYLLNFVLSFFGGHVPFLHQATPLGIGISVVIIIVAALNLFLDFNNIERGTRQGLAKHYEWASALGLFVTIVWLYLEILRLISMITSRD